MANNVSKTDPTKLIRTVCRVEDGVDCGILAHVEDGVLTKVEPAEFPRPGMRHICLKGLSTVKDLVYHPDRLKYPLKRAGKRGEDRWDRISWDEAFDLIAANFEKIIKNYGSESIAFAVGQLATSALMPIYLRLASALQASWIGIVGYGDAAGPCGDMLSYGLPLANHFTTDLEDPEFCIVWGGNYTETQPITWRRIRDLKENGARLVVVDPRFTATAAKANDHLMIRPGTDTALVLGMIKVILNKELVDEAFVASHTVGPFLVRADNGMFLREQDVFSGGSDKYIVWDSNTDRPQVYNKPGVFPALRGVYSVKNFECRPSFQTLADLANQYPLEKVSEITAIPPDAIERTAIGYATKKPAVIYRGYGMQRTFHGDIAWRAATTLAAVTGNIKLDGLRGFMLNRRDFTRVENKRCKSLPLLQMHEALATEKPYPIKALWVAATNLVNQNPDYNKIISKLLPQLDLIVTADIFMNTTAQYSDLVLPVCSFYECMDLIPPFDTVNPFMQLQTKVIEPLYESKSDVDIVNSVGTRLGFGEHFSRSEEEYLELLLSSNHPSLKGVTLERLRKQPLEPPAYDVPQIFRTPSGRIEFYAESMKSFGQELPLYIEPRESIRRPLAAKYPLAFISGHSRYLKCSMLANSSLLRELEPEPTLEMNPADADKRGIEDGDPVNVFNDRGKVELKVKIHRGIGPGVVNINQGWWPRDFRNGTHQALTDSSINPAQASVYEPNAALNDIRVEVEKMEKE